jgi:hypothetical protein
LLTQSLVSSNGYAVLSDHGYHRASIIFHYRLQDEALDYNFDQHCGNTKAIP